MTIFCNGLLGMLSPLSRQLFKVRMGIDAARVQAYGKACAEGRMAAGPQGREESPDSKRQRCRVTPGRGNPTESATENKPPSRRTFWPCSPTVRVKRWGKSPPGGWQQPPHGKPHREQCRIGTLRGFDRGSDITAGSFCPKVRVGS